MGKSSSVQVPTSFADVESDQSSNNPFDISFNVLDKLSIDPDHIDTLIVVADFSETADNRSFKTVLSDLTVYDVADSIKLTLTNEDGDEFIGSEDATAPNISVAPSDPDKSFFTYPNPFSFKRFNRSICNFSNRIIFCSSILKLR